MNLKGEDYMKLLEERIKKDGRVFPGDILKVDSFLNHQVDVKLMDEIGKEFHRLFDVKPDKILTIESSGIAIAQAASRYYDFCPIIYAKKTDASNMSSATYTCKERSYTRGFDYTITCSKEYLNKGDKILILDDFLANGEALNALINICQQAQVQILGVGAVVCKAYQPGEKRIKDMGVHLECLARVKAMHDDGTIEFCED